MKSRKVNSLVEHLVMRSCEKADAIIYTFLSEGTTMDVSYGMLHRNAAMAGGFLQARYRPGERMIVALKPGVDFVTSFFGCLYAGLIPVPLYPPVSQSFISKIRHGAKDAAPMGIIMSRDLVDFGRALGWEPGTLDLIDPEAFTPQWAEQWSDKEMTRDDIAFLQYTSGSTNHPKGVMVTHGNILENHRLIEECLKQEPGDCGVSWLPVYHDMGLIGNVLQACYNGLRHVIVSPLEFISDPLYWLELISTYRATISGAPNFAYELCVRRYDKQRCEKLDLGSWKRAYSGAEPVRGETIDKFARLFEAHGFSKRHFLPCYGLAENTLMASFGAVGMGPREIHVDKQSLKEGVAKPAETAQENTRRLISSGSCPSGQGLRIVDPDTLASMPQGKVGEIWLQGASAAKGYWNKEDLSRETFQAHTAEGEGPFLRTGDLGFLDNGELYVTGRMKDVIIICGRNYYPQDIELTVETSSDAIRPGRVVAASSGDDLIVLAEYAGPKENGDALAQDIRRNVKKDHDLNPAHVLLVDPKSLPVTTSGKIRRREAKERFEADTLDVIARYDALTEVNPAAFEDVASHILSILARMVDRSPDEIDPDLPFGHYGLTSFEAVELSKEISQISRHPFTPAMIFDYSTVNRLVDYVENGPRRIAIESGSHAYKRGSYSGDIAIVGMACRFPKADDVEAYWDNIEQSRDCVSGFPEDARTPFLDRVKGPFARCAGFIEDIDAFDAGFFNLSAKEATLMDPQHRIFLETVWHCLEHAGYAPGKLSGENVGVFAGVTSFDYSEVIREAGVMLEAYTITGLAHTMIANRTSYLLNVHGPSEAIDTACSSSLVAIHRAVNAIRLGGCAMAIAGGVNILLAPDSFMSLGRAGFLSLKGRCHTFDHQADGYVRGEGCGVVLLKPLEDAEKDGDFIHAVIRGTAVSHGGKSESLTAPSAASQARLIIKACRDAGVSPDSIGYIETHGTGTVLGDPIEIYGLTTAFEEMYALENKTFSRRSCALGAVKSNIGHLESAAGIAGLIKVVEILKKKTLPPSTHIHTVNPLIQLDGTPFYIPREKAIWPRSTDAQGNELPRRAGISSFGFGGTYAHMILEAYEKSGPVSDATGALCVFSAKSENGLVAQIRRFKTWLERPDHARLVDGHFLDTACTLARGRDHWPCRLAVVASNAGELIKGLSLFESGKAPHRVVIVSTEYDDLSQAGSRWVQGGDLDWSGLVRERLWQKIPLPGYVFEKKRFFAFNKREKQPEVQADAPDRKQNFTYEEIVSFLTRELEMIVESEGIEIDPDTPFDDYGMNSMAVISLFNSLETYTGWAIDPSVIKNHQTIGRLAKFMEGGMKDKGTEPDLYGDAKLDEFLFQASTPEAPSHGKAVLLTGSTGYLGAYLLVELLRKTQAEIYCLVRAENEEEGLKRIIDAVISHGAASSLSCDRIHVVPGDLGTWKLGLDRNTFNHLASTIDTIWHCGAAVDWMKPYDSLKKTNVDGTRAIIHLASHKTLKHLHFVSSLAVLPVLTGKTEWAEQEVEAPNGITSGYGQSKWVAEQLCLKAGKWGVPVSVYRFDYVAGKPGSGIMKETDFIARLIKGCIQLGSIPLEETNFDIIAVDGLCAMMVAIAKAESPRGNIYHLINRRPFSTSDFARLIRSRGYNLQRIPFDEWKMLTRKDPKNALYPLYPFINTYTTESFEVFASWRVDNTRAMTALYHEAPSLIRDMADAGTVLESVMDHLTASGFLPKGVFGRMLECHKTYWQTQLEGAKPHTPLPARNHVKGNRQGPMAHRELPWGYSVRNVIEKTAQEYGLEPQVLLLTLAFVLFSRYSRQKDITVAVLNRDRAASSPIFIRNMCSPDKVLGAMAFETAHLLDQAWVHRDLPRDILENMLGLSKDEPYPLGFVWNSPDSNVSKSVRWPLFISLTSDAHGLQGRIVYDASVYDLFSIESMAAHLSNLVEEMGCRWDKPLSNLSMISRDERQTLVYEMNRTEQAYPSERSVTQLFDAMAKTRPGATALVFEQEQMTYGELNRQSDCLAVYLHDRGIGKGHVVGLCVERSMTMMVSVLGILKSGAAYLPLDPDYPAERLAHMITDAGVQVIVCNLGLTDILPVFDGDMIVLESQMDDIRSMENRVHFSRCLDHLKRSSEPGDLAYIIYTSGSTGKPKGVRAMHKGLVNLVYGMDRWINFTPDDTMLGLTRLSFDMVKPELFMPLLKGGKLHIISQEVARDGFLLKAFLENNPITVMQATPSSWRLLLYAAWKGNPDMTMITGGEALPEDLAAILAAKGKKLLNLYGPTETTVWSTGAEIDGTSGVNIGYPLANTRLYVLDEDMNPVPKGVPGELYIGGHGVTQGYHLRQDLTKERYLPDPFVEDHETMYRTGDLVRMRQDGALEYLERIDHQVKIRGYRIELNEIERALSGISGIKEAVVLARNDTWGEKVLRAFMVPESDSVLPETLLIRRTLEAQLPPWMVPASFTWVDQMPLNKNGKIDRNVLGVDSPSSPARERHPGSEPRTETEAIVMAMWEGVLDVTGLGVTDNVMEWGADSLKGMRVLMDIRERFEVDLTVQKLLKNLTIRELSRTIDRMKLGVEDKEQEMADMMI